MSTIVTPSSGKPTTSRHLIQVEHIRIDTAKSFDAVRAALDALPKFDERIRVLLREGKTDEVRAELERIQGDVGLTVFSVATHGDWLEILSGRQNALQYVIGNILVSTQMTVHKLAAGLYAPLRIMLYESTEGGAALEYDLPSSLFGQYGDERVTAVARDLDLKIQKALIAAAS
jgi:uncharacterized protein (DUF302 family)